MKKVILSYDNKDKTLIRTIKPEKSTVQHPRLSTVILTKQNEICKVVLTVNNGDDMNECITLLRSKPHRVNRNMVRKGSMLMYEHSVDDVSIPDLMEELIKDLPTVYN